MHSYAKPLPFCLALPGIGGTLKAAPSHFCVTELPEKEAAHPNAKHLFVTLTREGANTRDVQARLAEAYGVAKTDDVGFAGLKDRWARATQACGASFKLPDRRIIAHLLTR